MPIELDYQLLREFEEKELKIIKKNRTTSIILAIIGIILNICVYFSVTLVGFRSLGVSGYYFTYSFFINTIDTFYWITWVAITLASFSLLLNIYLLRFTINPFIIILKKRKNQKQEELTKKINAYKKTISIRMLCQLILWIGMIIHLNYYPRKTFLFYPFIGCNPYSGYCIITETVFFQFVLIMSSFLFAFIGLYISIIIIDRKELLKIQKKSTQLKVKEKRN